MTNCKDEQLMEIEALEALFTNEGEFEKINENEFYLNILPYPDNSKTNHNFVRLKINYTANYPVEPPIWDFDKLSGIEVYDEVELRDTVKSIVQSSLGMPMIYNIADAIQLWLRENNKPLLSMHAQMIEREKREGGGGELAVNLHNGYNELKNSYIENSDDEYEADEEEIVFKGLIDKDLCNPEERVTKEIFEKWSNEFKLEMENKRIWKKIEKKDEILTGKQMFMQDNALAITDNDGSDDEKIY